MTETIPLSPLIATPPLLHTECTHERETHQEVSPPKPIHIPPLFKSSSNKLFKAQKMTKETTTSEFILSAYQTILETDIHDLLRVGSEIALPLFSEETLKDLCQETVKRLSSQPMVINLESPICVVGDIHGSIHDLLRIFILNGNPSSTHYLFLGDYVDRGQFSIEVISILFSMYCQGTHITLLRGNHEHHEICANYGFKAELESVYQSTDLFDSFTEAFEYLPLVAIINQSIFCVHGGISQHFTTVNAIASIPRPLKDCSQPGLVHDLLWSDPSPTSTGFSESLRGNCLTFGCDAMRHFLMKSNLRLVIRAHQYIEQGVHSDLNNTCITVFSASSYHGNGSNKSAVIHLDGEELKPEYYDPLPRLERASAQFFSMRRQALFPRQGCVTLSNNFSKMALFAQKRRSSVSQISPLHPAIKMTTLKLASANKRTLQPSKPTEVLTGRKPLNELATKPAVATSAVFPSKGITVQTKNISGEYIQEFQDSNEI